MQAYAYRVEQPVWIRIITEEGDILLMREFDYISKGLKENVYKWARHCDVQWVDKPWEHTGIKDAHAIHKLKTGIDLENKEIAWTGQQQ